MLAFAFVSAQAKVALRLLEKHQSWSELSKNVTLNALKPLDFGLSDQISGPFFSLPPN